MSFTSLMTSTSTSLIAAALSSGGLCSGCLLFQASILSRSFRVSPCAELAESAEVDAGGTGGSVHLQSDSEDEYSRAKHEEIRVEEDEERAYAGPGQGTTLNRVDSPREEERKDRDSEKVSR